MPDPRATNKGDFSAIAATDRAQRAAHDTIAEAAGAAETEAARVKAPTAADQPSSSTTQP
jgi:hypothetical protein